MKRQKTSILVLAIFIAVAMCLPGLVRAGSLEPPGAPVPTMHTLDEIYKKITNVTRFPQCEGKRFLDLLDGTVADCETGLIWMKKANCDGTKTWTNALAFCDGLASGNCVLGDGSLAGDWRLPSVRELQSLVDTHYINPVLSNGAGTDQWSEGDAFDNVQSDYYWSVTPHAGDTAGAWYVGMHYGWVGYGHKSYNFFYVWCVRGGP